MQKNATLKSIIKRITASVLTLSLLFVFTLQTEAAGSETKVAAAKKNVIVVIPGILGSELTNGSTGQKVWVGLGSLNGEIRCNEQGASVFSIFAYNDDNYGTNDTYKTL